MVSYICSPSYWETETGGSPDFKSLRPTGLYTMRPHLKIKLNQMKQNNNKKTPNQTVVPKWMFWNLNLVNTVAGGQDSQQLIEKKLSTTLHPYKASTPNLVHLEGI